MEVIFKSPMEMCTFPPQQLSSFQPFQARMCVFVCACARASYRVQALLSFSGVWTAGRVLLIGQNDAEMDRKPLWSSCSSFSSSFPPSLLAHSLRLNHSLPPALLPLLAVAPFPQPCLSSGPRCCSTNFSHPFIPAIRPFSPKALWASRGSF